MKVLRERESAERERESAEREEREREREEMLYLLISIVYNLFGMNDY